MFYNKLHRIGGSAPRRQAFSLAELVISMGILVLMLSLAGQVFNLTIQSTGQATALTESMQALRVFEQTLREDLRHVHPGRSVILIQGNPVNAYWTAREREADDDASSTSAGPASGYPHAADPNRELSNGNLAAPRADILMFFTESESESVVAKEADAKTPVRSNLQQVVYGHAELGEFVINTTTGQFELQPRFPPPATGTGPQAFPTETIAGARYPSTTRVSVDPAENWHLARRSILLLPTTSARACLTPPATRLDDARLLSAESDVVCNFRYEEQVFLPQWDATSGAPIGGPWFPPSIFGNPTQPYASWIKPFERSVMDPTPPPTKAVQLAHYMLPRCASFKVEWSLDPRGEFVAGRLDGVNDVLWFDPGDMGNPADAVPSPDPLRSLQERVDSLKVGSNCPNVGANAELCRSLESLLNERTAHLDGGYYSLSDRFRGNALPGADPEAWDPLGPVPRPNATNLALFTASRPAPTGVRGETVPDDMFPHALRITVDLFDRDRRLDRPIRHVMVIPIGE